MPLVLQEQLQSSPDSASSVDSTVNSPFVYDNHSSSPEKTKSISELLGLNMPRGTTLGQTSNSIWSPSASSSPVPVIRPQGMRPPCFAPFGSLDTGFNWTDSPSQLRSMPSVNSSGFDLTQPFSPISPLCAPRAMPESSLYSSNCSSPQMDSAVLQNRSSRSDSPSDSEASNISSTNLSDSENPLNVSKSSGGICSPPTEQELINLHALYTLTSSPVPRTLPALPPLSLLYLQAQNQLDNRQWSLNNNIDMLDKVAKFHMNQAASYSQAACTWSGVLPQRFSENPIFSCKVFLGGVPWDVTEETLMCVFGQFGKVRVEWPGKEHAASQPKGYVYIIFDTEKQVKALLNSCTRDVSCGNCENWYFRISSRKMKSKEVQVIPWSMADSNYVTNPSQKLDPQTTVFVGALHGMLNAEGLFRIMSDLFGGVVYAGIDTDKFKYPIGSARVTFNNRNSYIRAVMAAFIEIKTTKFTKKVQVNPYLEDSSCSNCNVQQGPYFCRELVCFRYFCRSCWMLQHQSELLSTHMPLMRSSKNNNNSLPQMRFTNR